MVCAVVSDSLWPPWTVACQALLSLGFLMQEYWSGLPFPPPGDLPSPGREHPSPHWQADTLVLMQLGSPKRRKPDTNGRILWLCFYEVKWKSNTGVGRLSLLQGIFLTQESNWGLLHCRQILYQLSYQGSPRIMEWIAYPFSSRSSRPKNWTRVSCIASGFFTNWTIREAICFYEMPQIGKFIQTEKVPVRRWGQEIKRDHNSYGDS